jgi:hypothetical protein
MPRKHDIFLHSPWNACSRHALDIEIIVENQEGGFEELRGHPKELNLDVSTEEFLSADRAFTYADLYAMLGNGNVFVVDTPRLYYVRRRDGAGLL